MTSKLKYILFVALFALGAVLLVAGFRRWGGALRSFLEVENERRREQELIDRQAQQQLDQSRIEKEQQLAEYARRKRDEKLESQRQYREGVRIAEERAKEAVEKAQTQKDLDEETDAALDRHTKYLNGQGGRIRWDALWCLCVFGFSVWSLSLPVTTPIPYVAAATSKPSQAQRERTRKILATLDRYQQLVEKLKRDLALEKEASRKLVALKVKHARQEERILWTAKLKRSQAEIKACAQKQSILLRYSCPPCWPHVTVAGLVVAGICGGVIGIREATRPCP